MQRRSVFVLAVLLSVVFIPHLSRRAVSAQSAGVSTFKVAFWNIKSGEGQPMANQPSPFVATGNCTNTAQPLNAWGVGVVPQELLAKVGSDPAVVALGVAEAWNCANPSAVQQVLGWAVRTASKNGVTLIARYGFLGPEAWLQVDTSLASNPTDTMWAVRAPVCLDVQCTRSTMVYAAHAGISAALQLTEY